MSSIRTRFAPSPTGYLHVGGLRTALYAYLFAKKQGGQFLLRIEDTDRERFVDGAVKNIVESLRWAGMTIDEGVDIDDHGQVIQKGDHGPYIQSERLSVYKEQINVLLEKGSAYYCFCSKERLDELRKTQEAMKQPTMYDGHCRSLPLSEAEERLKNGETAVVRMMMPKEGETVFTDLIRGEVRFQNALIDDQVLLKTDGYPTYHFAVVVDDHIMGITHVIRGEEWVSSTPKHLQLYAHFGWEAPAFAHLSLLLNPDKSKLSKRQGDVSVQDYRDKGYLPEALVNFVAFLGWNPGDERELFTIEELEKEFSLDRVSKAGAVFNLEKLDWYNQQYIRSLPDDTLVTRAIPYLVNSGLVTEVWAEEHRSWLRSAIGLEKERMTKLQELPDSIRFVFLDTLTYDPSILIWKKGTKEDAQEKLQGLVALLETVSDEEWQRAPLEKQIRAWMTEKGYGTGDVLWPMRVALSGQKNSPGPFDIAEVLGKEKTLARLRYALTLLV